MVFTMVILQDFNMKASLCTLAREPAIMLRFFWDWFLWEEFVSENACKIFCTNYSAFEQDFAICYTILI
jgi:hypothetical protein